MDYKKIYIGAWTDPISKDTISVENPVTTEEITKIPACHEEDVNLAVEKAYETFLEYKKTSIEERIKWMEEFYQELLKSKEELIKKVHEELGVNLSFAEKNHVTGTVESIKDYIKIAKNYNFEENFDDGKILKDPYGVVGAITPWNYPLSQIMAKIVPAILAGNTVVLKPSQKTPLTAYVMMDAFDRTGFPKGVLNLVPGRGAEVGNTVAENKKVSLLSFTGSTGGGLELYKIAAGTGKKVILEMGGKSPAILLDREYAKIAVSTILKRLFINVGQTCSAWTRFFVHKNDLEEVKKLILEEVDKYEFADPRDGNRIIGPLISKEQFDKVRHYIEEGLREGAELICGEEKLPFEGHYSIKPHIFVNATNDMKISREEIFGPVLSIIEYDDVKDAIKMANDNIYGLSAAVYGEFEEALEVAREIESGEVYINGEMSSSPLPFGGYKLSGIGREHGYYGFEEYLQTKSIHFRKK